jgi:tetratricopeptide (TPR) repeat protein
MRAQDTSTEIQQHTAKVESALRANDLATAETEYRKIIALDPANGQAWTGLGILLYGEGKAGAAVSALNSALKINPQEDRADLFLGLSEADLGHCDKATPILSRHFENGAAGKLNRLTGLALLDCIPTKTDAMPALKVAARLKTLYPDDPDVLYKSAELDTRLWDQDAGQLMAKHPDSYRVHQLAGEVYEAQGNIDQAVREYQLALSENPKLPQMHYRIGQLYLKKGEADVDQKAMEEFRAESRVDPQSAVSALAMGEIYRYQHQLDNALAQYQLASRLDPELVEARIGLARVLLEKHQIDASIEDLHAVIKDHPDNAKAHYALMLAYREHGEIDQAGQEMEIFKKLQQSDAEHFDNRLNVLLNNKTRTDETHPF